MTEQTAEPTVVEGETSAMPVQPYTADVRAQALIDNLWAEVTDLGQTATAYRLFQAQAKAEIAMKDSLLQSLAEQLSDQSDRIANLEEALDLLGEEAELLRMAVPPGVLDSGEEEPEPKIDLEDPSDPRIDAGNVDRIAQDILIQPVEKPLYQPSWESEPLVSREAGQGGSSGSFGEDLVRVDAEPQGDPSGD